MSRAQQLLNRLEEALSPRTKKVLKYGAGAAAAAGAGYLAYKHGGDVLHHFTGNHSAPKTPNTSQGQDWHPREGEEWKPSHTPEPEQKPETRTSGEEQSKGVTASHQHAKYTAGLQKKLAQHKEYTKTHENPSHDPEVIRRRADAVEAGKHNTNIGELTTLHGWKKLVTHFGVTGDDTQNTANNARSAVDNAYHASNLEYRRHRNAAQNITQELKDRQYPR